VWILGQFENRPGRVRVTLRRSTSRPDGSQPRAEAPAAPDVLGPYAPPDEARRR
jgi:hypothetical protein